MYEPIARFTQGELFFPCPVDGYVAQCSLWRRHERVPDELLMEAGTLDLEKLTEIGAAARGQLYLRFVQEPLSGLEYRRWKSHTRPEFEAPARLARVGLPGRFLDALFSLSLFLRGRVPGGTAAAASLQYEPIREEYGYPYYARVIRDGAYTVLHYSFFYAMNDWRSSFFGVNDHEADWEQVFVYLGEGESGLEPVWVAYSSHNYSGDDLRRRWDDPELTRQGNHPVVYVGAGSHAAYFRPGDYLIMVELAFLRPAMRALDVVRRIWRDILRQGDPSRLAATVEALLKVPFVEYARGDGIAIGPGQEAEWSMVMIDDEVGWVHHYRGLWGLDVPDIFAGERAPAGPKYTLAGFPRRTWYDPVGWAGLTKVATPASEAALIDDHLLELEREADELEETARSLRAALPRLELEFRALQEKRAAEELQRRMAADVAREEARLAAIELRKAEIRQTREALARYRAEPPPDAEERLRRHIGRRIAPEDEEATHRGRIREFWAAVSTGIVLLGAVALIAAGLTGGLVAVLSLFALVIVVESILTGKIERLLLNLAIVLAVASGAVLLFEFFWQVVLAAAAGLGLLILYDNLRELRRK
jgi:hypothetical protein